MKITMIGAGSSIYALSLIKDICLTKNLHNNTFCFMDINAEKLDTTYKLCTRYAQEMNCNIEITKTLSRQEALEGAGYVIVSALAAGYDRLNEGWEIAEKYGYQFGGSMHIFHDEAFWINFYQLAMMEDIAQDMLRICPDAWYILSANPVLAGTCHLKRKFPQLKFVGMCHGFIGAYTLAKTLKLDHENITFEVPGVNHFIWLSKIYCNGENVFPMLDEFLKNGEAQRYWGSQEQIYDDGPLTTNMYQRFGAYPIGDTCHPAGGSFGYWYHDSPQTEKLWRMNPKSWYSDYFMRNTERISYMKQVADDATKKVTEIYPPDISHDQIIPLIEALACDIERKIIVNILNDKEYLPGVPKDFEVEIPALVSKKGVQGIRVDALPKPVMSWMYREYIAPTEMELAAYNEGKKEYLLQLILMDQWSKSEQQAKDFLDEILALPYHDAMRQHYK